MFVVFGVCGVAGFSEVCNPQSIRCFSADELEELICGGAADSNQNKWDFSISTLRKYTKCRQGYTHASRAVQHLFSIISEFDAKEQRMFVRFVTGCPRLPMGGLKNLNPPLAIVPLVAATGIGAPTNANNQPPGLNSPLPAPAPALPVSGGGGATSSAAAAARKPLFARAGSGSSAGGRTTREPLPSVSTCTMTLKLPDYPTKEQMKPKLLLAMHECQTGFTLS